MEENMRCQCKVVVKQNDITHVDVYECTSCHLTLEWSTWNIGISEPANGLRRFIGEPSFPEMGDIPDGEAVDRSIHETRRGG
jgi:hypothetical protein